MDSYILIAEFLYSSAGWGLFLASPVIIIEYILIPFFKSQQR